MVLLKIKIVKKMKIMQKNYWKTYPQVQVGFDFFRIYKNFDLIDWFALRAEALNF